MDNDPSAGERLRPFGNVVLFIFTSAPLEIISKYTSTSSTHVGEEDNTFVLSPEDNTFALSPEDNTFALSPEDNTFVLSLSKGNSLPTQIVS